MAPESPDSENGQIGATVAQVSERAALLVREEIELAKAELVARGKKLAVGAVVGLVSGVFFLGTVIFLLIGGAWGLWSLIFANGDNNIWAGFYIVAGALLLGGILAGGIAFKALKGGSPPKPEMAMEEARKIKETVGAAKEGNA